MLALLVASLVAAQTPPTSNSPNIVILLTDDQATGTVSAWGAQNCRTPNMDRIAAGGMSFHRTYCQGAWHGAVCIPSRAMIMTARRLSRVTERMEGIRSLPEHLRDHGYRTFGIGKWHNGEASFARILGDGASVFFGGMCDHENVPLKDCDAGSFVNERRGDGFSSSLFADAAVEYLQGYDSVSPFFLWVAFTAPHDPRQPRQEWVDATLPTAHSLPPNFLPQHPFQNGWLVGRDESLAPWPRPANLIKDSRREYVAMVEHLDREVGRILDAIELRKDGAETIIILASDHGLAIGSHGLLGKQSLYEHSQRAVFAMRGPGIPAGQSTESLTLLYDIAPTALSLAGLPAMPDIDGQDLTPLLQDPQLALRNGVFTRFGNCQRAWTQSRYKLIRYPRVGVSQMFDLDHDPDEIKDLSSDPDFQDILKDLENQLRVAQHEVDDDLPFTLDPLEPEAVDLTGRARKPDGWQPQSVIDKYFAPFDEGE